MQWLPGSIAVLPRIASAALMALAFTLGTVGAHAQQPEFPVACDEGVIAEPIMLAYGEHTINCEIGFSTDVDRFEFQATAGDVVRFNLNSTGNLMDPRIEIREPIGAGATLIEDRFCTDSCSISIEPPDFLVVPSATLNHTGTYTIFISDLNANDTGTYSLQIELIQPFDPAEQIFFDNPTNDSVSQVTDVDLFDFQATAGDEIRVLVTALGNLMDPRIEIWDPVGTKLANSTCTDSCTQSLEAPDFVGAPMALSVTGTYRIAISDAGLNDSGDYRLNLQCLVGACDPVPPSTLTLETAGEIDSPTDMDMYEYEAFAGTQIRVALNSTGNLMDSRVEIWDPSGAKLVSSSCNDSCTLTLETPDFSGAPSALLQSGTYRVAVSDAGVNDSGLYEISIHCLQGTCDSDQDGPLDPPRRPAMEYGAPALSRMIENDTDMDCFSLYGTNGDLIRLTVNAAGNLMDPRLELWAPDDTKVDSVSCTDSCTIVRDVTLTQTGNYDACLSDVSINDSGPYSLGLECIIGTCIDDPNPAPTTGDNCVDVPNAPPLDCDTDGDGYGNACDGDFTQNGVIDATDFTSVFLVDFATGVDGGTGTDMNCSGTVDATDFLDFGPAPWLTPSFLRGFRLGNPGPGLSCADSGTCP